LEKDVYIIGVSTRVEVWDKSKWESYSGDENMSAESIAERWRCWESEVDWKDSKF